jgi:hypothetical protein
MASRPHDQISQATELVSDDDIVVDRLGRSRRGCSRRLLLIAICANLLDL